jgi:hypothetical protein
MIVALTNREMIQAGLAGVLRSVESIHHGFRGQKRAEGYEMLWQRDIEGALGELAFAKAMDRHWTGNERLKARDVGEWEVRTSSLPLASLIIRSHDRDEQKFALVVGSDATYTVCGWFLAGEAKDHKEWLYDPGHRKAPAWWVPQSELHSMKETP